MAVKSHFVSVEQDTHCRVTRGGEHAAEKSRGD